MRDLIKKIHGQAQKIGACELFRGDETIGELASLFLSPQGQEFCLKNGFPSIETLRRFREHGVERYGIYIDAGAVTIKNPTVVVIVGRTSATVDCDTLDGHEVVLMHGAKAVVNARGWAVVKVSCGTGCTVKRNVSDNAIVL